MKLLFNSEPPATIATAMAAPEVFKVNQINCVTVNPKSPSEEATRIMFRDGTRKVSCPLLVNGACAAIVDKVIPCKQLSPGKYYFPDTPPRSTQPLSTLTMREVQILNLEPLLPSREIADRLRLAQRTVKGHRENVCAKLGVNTELEAVLHGAAAGLVDMDEATRGLDPNAVQKLTRRHKEIMDVITDSLGETGSAKDIAGQLVNSKRTVEGHIGAILARLHAATTTQAALLYVAGKRQTAWQQ